MKKQLLLILLLIPIFTRGCLEAELIPPKDLQAIQTFEVKIENPTDETVRFTALEVHFSEAQNFSKSENYTCVLWEGNKCKTLVWKENRDIIPDLGPFKRQFDVDLCLQDGESLTVTSAVKSECPLPYFKKSLDTKTYQVRDGVVCSDFQQYQTGLFENLTVESYFRSYGGDASLNIIYSDHPENITYYDSLCGNNTCGVYENFTKKLDSMPYTFQICANATDSEIIFRNIVTWWRFSNFETKVEWDTKIVDVVGRPKIGLIRPSVSPVLENKFYNLTVGVGSFCGNSKMEVTGSVDNETIAHFEPKKTKKINLKNKENGFVFMQFFTNQTGEINFTIKAKVDDETETKYYKINVKEDPTRCPGNYTYCGGECKLNPRNCTQGCATGGTFCYDNNVFCELYNCGDVCPSDSDKVCDAAGNCKFAGREGWSCNCNGVCKSHYTEAGVCFHSAECVDKKCTYLSKICAENATCTSSGCCGDGVCDPSESCLTCTQDCGCEDDNPCTEDVCTGTCFNRLLICGYPCPGGGCDGKGNCLSNVCCRNEDCTLNPCKKGTCENNQCQFVEYSCIPCPDGFCYEGDCYYFLAEGESCPCSNSCNGTLTCYNGKCSTCGNNVCEVGECAICPEDCPESFCPKGSFLGTIVIITVIGLFVIGLLAYFRII